MRWQGFYHHVFCTYSEVTTFVPISDFGQAPQPSGPSGQSEGKSLCRPLPVILLRDFSCHIKQIGEVSRKEAVPYERRIMLLTGIIQSFNLHSKDAVEETFRAPSVAVNHPAPLLELSRMILRILEPAHGSPNGIRLKTCRQTGLIVLDIDRHQPVESDKNNEDTSITVYLLYHYSGISC